MVRVVDRWEIPDVGVVCVMVSDRARYMRLTLGRDGVAKLTVPAGVSLRRGRQFLESKVPWLRKHAGRFRGEEASGRARLSRAEARRVLTGRVRDLATAHGLTYNRVFVKNQRTLWGSCSARNNINLNVNLLRLPEELRDYVILHELVHTRHKNHGKAFWHEMNRLTGDGKQLQKRLRRYKLSP